MNLAVLEFSEAAIWPCGGLPTVLLVTHREQNFLLDRRDRFFLYSSSSDPFPGYCYWKTLVPEPLHQQLLISL